jgi:hypothetical protein
MGLILALLTHTVDIIDSRDDSKTTYVVVDDDCKVSVQKKNLSDMRKIIEKVNRECDLDLNIGDLR